MKNILIVVPDLNNPAGTERAAISLANSLTHDYEVTLLSLTEQKNELFFDIEPKVQLIYLDAPANTSITEKAAWFYYCYINIRKVIKRHNINVLIGLTHNVNCVISLFSSRGIKAIGCEHIDYATIPKTSKLIINKAYPKLNALVVLSDQAYANTKHLNKNVVIIPNPLSFESKESSTLGNNRILMVGRLSKEKGIERILPLAKYMLNNYPNWYIEIFGDGSLRADIENMITQNALSNVRLNSSVRDIKTEYLNSSIYLSTSYTEALPMSFLEAMQCGVPVISYKHPGSDALIANNVNGIVVESENQLIQQTSSLIEDIELRKTLGQNGKIFSSKFTTPKIKLQWTTLLESLNKN